MTDYRHDLRFGTTWWVAAEDTRPALDLAVLAERIGFDLVTFADHPYSVIPGDPDQRLKVDVITLMAAVAARTETIGIGVNVFTLPLRPPTTIARTAASLDLLSGGRFELALGTGALWDSIAAEGGPRRAPGESVVALEEAIGVIRALMTPGPPVVRAGEHYRLDGVIPGPFPVRDMKIWVGAYQPRMQRLIGRIADGWLPSSPYLPPAAIAHGNKVIDEAAEAAGRAPGDIQRLYNITGEFRATGTGFLVGPPAQWAEQLAELTLSEGVSTYLLYRIEDPDFLRRFAAEVAPAVRAMVARERALPKEKDA